MTLSPGQTNLWARNLDRAIYLPSVQSVWTEVISSNMQDLRPNGPIPTFFDNTDFLNFMLPMPQSAFWWPRILYSPGHAPLDLNKMEERQSDVLRKNRPKQSVIVTDSGGYQIATNAKGTFSIDWDDTQKADNLRERVLKWQEAVSEWAIVLDIPSYAIAQDEPHPFFGHDFQKCLDVTLENLNYIVNKRTGATKFMNVIQGHNAQQIEQWYQAVKSFPFEGWAFPIGRIGWLEGLKLLRQMLDEKQLDNAEWIHFLGIGTPHSAIGFSAIKRTLQSILGNEDLEISYDTSSPFQDMSRYKLNLIFERKYKNSLSTLIPKDINPLSEHIDSEESFLPYSESPVMGCGILKNTGAVAMGEMHLDNGKGGARFDKLSLATIATHNIWKHLAAIADAHDRVESLEKTARAKPHMVKTIPDLLDEIKGHYVFQQELKGAAGPIMALQRKLYEEEGIPVRLPHGGLSYTHNKYDKSIADEMDWTVDMNEIIREVFTSEMPIDVLEKNKDALRDWL